MWKSTVDWRLVRELEIGESAGGRQKVVSEKKAITRTRKRAGLAVDFILNEGDLFRSLGLKKLNAEVGDESVNLKGKWVGHTHFARI